MEHTDNENTAAKLQNQTCLFSNQEPLQSYLEQKTDCFYLKLRLVLKDGTGYETQASFIDRGSPRPVPEEFTASATFASSMLVLEKRPFRGYGRYQLTVNADASSGDIASCLPKTIPVEIELQKNLEHITEGTIDCPVAWKSLSLPPLSPGESVTIADAAEEIVIPAGTVFKTPTGIFYLEEPLPLDNRYGLSDEIQLVLNTVPKDGAPTGVLKEENTGLELAFDLKPTGATSIQAYVLPENGLTWTKLSALRLPEILNDQPSTASSGYSLVIGKDQEPYRSYLAQKAAGNTQTPFFIGLSIEGGVYDGRQLILAWPEVYDLPVALPKLNGAGGNEADAGADNRHDGTAEGQRPYLPQNSEDGADSTDASYIPQDSSNTSNDNNHFPGDSSNTPNDSSHFPGNSTSTTNDSNHTPGDSSNTSWDSSHFPRDNTSTTNDSNHTPGDNASTTNDNTHFPGNNASTPNDSNHFPGNASNLLQDSSHIPGDNTSTTNDNTNTPGDNPNTPNDNTNTPGDNPNLPKDAIYHSDSARPASSASNANTSNRASSANTGFQASSGLAEGQRSYLPQNQSGDDNTNTGQKDNSTGSAMRSDAATKTTTTAVQTRRKFLPIAAAAAMFLFCTAVRKIVPGSASSRISNILQKLYEKGRTLAGR